MQMILFMILARVMVSENSGRSQGILFSIFCDCWISVVRCLTFDQLLQRTFLRSHRLEIDFKDKNFKNLLV